MVLVAGSDFTSTSPVDSAVLEETWDIAYNLMPLIYLTRRKDPRGKAPMVTAGIKQWQQKSEVQNNVHCLL
ncbi:hypothetical protein GCM10023186_03060 [Hymenobacter koreensis]|uniref:Uncharacterized protein n=1 Tax=Hymenobacter koreensis TaxID=1084523 RepID=A0ABP8ITY0_9BACT